MPLKIANLLTFLALVAIPTSRATAQLSFEREPIGYSKSEATDPVANLRGDIDAGTVTLPAEGHHTRLRALLAHLQIPIASQTLVFSKGSMQRHLISPANPRAIYFNDEVYVGWIPGGERIELASTDVALGSVFYTVEQSGTGDNGRLQRHNARCLFCHASTNTGRVPGLLMLSVYTDRDGNRAFPFAANSADADGRLHQRFGGWYVTGNHGSQDHLGNFMVDSTSIVSGPRRDTGNVVDLSGWLNTNKYLSPHSDLVALLVLQHQVTIHNRLTDACHRARLLIHEAEQTLSPEDKLVLDQIAERVVDGLLMVDSIELKEPVSGTSRFAEQFAQRGPFDQQGRSLREFDLRTKLFRYPCSYLIYGESFDKLPDPLLAMVSQRLFDVLTGDDTRAKYGHLSVDDRTAVLEILRHTKTNLEW